MLERYKRNPILKPKRSNSWESKAVFNCGVVMKDGIIHMLYRAIGEYEQYTSRLGYARSEDGINFVREDKPVFEPATNYEAGGCEDPRLTLLDDKVYMTYVAVKLLSRSKGMARTALATTEDFHKFRRHGVITPSNTDDKDVLLFPELINNNYILLHRPEWVGSKYNTTSPSIWIAYAISNPKKWHKDKLLLHPIEWWERRKVGSGTPPIKTKYGWLTFYHGVDIDHVYRAGALLLDLNDPSKIIAKSDVPVLQPKEKYETNGDVPNVVFPTGVTIMDNKLYVYYGAADKVICLATADLDAFLDTLKDINH